MTEEQLISVGQRWVNTSAVAGFALLSPAMERRAVRSWCRFGVPAGADREWLQGM